MLPSRSKRFALANQEVPRLVLTTPWQLLLITGMVLSVLVTIFPRKQLLSTLYEQRTLDPLTRSYIQNLYRAETSNIDAALLLARTQEESEDISHLEDALLPATIQGTARQRQEAFTILFDAYQWQTLHAQTTVKQNTARAQLTTLLRRAGDQNLSNSTMETFVLAALELGLKATGMRMVATLNYPDPVNSLQALGARALANGQYTAAASCFFFAQRKAVSIPQQRQLFQRGIETYMAANLFDTALQAARQDIGNLEDDLPTLRFLARTALSAGAPSEAARYARQLVFANPLAAVKR
jgi:polysaccharide biosynthesis protein PelB